MADNSCTYNYFNYYADEDEAIESIAEKFHCNAELIEKMNANHKAGLPFKIPNKQGGCGRGRFYVIQNGETINDIAKKFHTSIDYLLKANPYFNPNNYILGQTIIIPVNRPKDQSLPMASTYEVGQSETIADILRRFDMSIVELRNLNTGIDIFKMKPGDIIKIKEAKYTTPTNPNIFLYTLQSGETLNTVSEKFGINTLDILKCNPDIRPLEFIPGQRIHIPYKQI